MKLFAFILTIAFASIAVPAKATIITGITNGTTVNGTYGASAFVGAGGNDDFVGGGNTNTITLNATLDSGYVIGTPFTWRFDFTDTQGGAADGATEYLVTLNLTTNIIHPISNVFFDLSAPTITSSVPLGNTPAGAFQFDIPSNPTPTSTYNGINLVTPSLIVFGGVAGGGGELYAGQTATFTFSIDLPDYSGIVTTGSFFLTMTPTPEPAGLLLGAIAISGAGGAVWRRRKTNSASKS